MTRPARPSSHRTQDAGFTLIEVLVSLAIFAVIGGAGFGILQKVLQTQRMTEGRLDRLGAMERAMHVLTLDFLQTTPGTFQTKGGTVAIERAAPEMAEGSIAVRYEIGSGILVREVSSGLGATPVDQPLLDGVSASVWKFYSKRAGWSDTWPPRAKPQSVGAFGIAAGGGAVPDNGLPPNPEAVALTLTLIGIGRDAVSLTRVALLPDTPQ